MNIRKLNGNQIGNYGEYLVCGELAKMGYLASLTYKGAKTVDILASNKKGSKSVAIQVKTTMYNGYNTKPSWKLTEKDENYSDNLFYIFVFILGDGEDNYFYIVPSKEVAKKIKLSHSQRIKKRKILGKSIKEFNDRRFVDTEEFFRDRWDLLGLD